MGGQRIMERFCHNVIYSAGNRVLKMMYCGIYNCVVGHKRSIARAGLLFGNIPVFSLPDLDNPIS
jgi:hypothetical protein